MQRSIGLDLAKVAMEPARALWSPRHPNLIEATLEIVDDDVLVAQVTSYAGLRRVEARDGRFLLNGEPYFLRLALAQNYWPC